MTLKTINDLNENIDIPPYNQGLANPVITFKCELRKEAIAWIKELKKEQKISDNNCPNLKCDKDGSWYKCDCIYLIETGDDYYNFCQKYSILQWQIEWIQRFFCISESELQ